jgi:hypothetical protein
LLVAFFAGAAGRRVAAAVLCAAAVLAVVPAAHAQAPPPECPSVSELPVDPAPSDAVVQAHAAREDAAAICERQVHDAELLRDALRSAPLPVRLDAGPGLSAQSPIFIEAPAPQEPAAEIGVALSEEDRAMIETAYSGVNGTAWYIAGLLLALGLGYVIYRQVMPRA